MVAFRCRERRTPSPLAASMVSAKKAAQRLDVHDGRVEHLAGLEREPSFRTVVSPSFANELDARRVAFSSVRGLAP
jgi:hypothetical protein